MMYVLNFKKNLDTNSIKKYISTIFSINELEVMTMEEYLGNPSAVSSHDQINFELITRSSNAGFRFELQIFISDELCLDRKIYNAFQVALFLSEAVNDEVLIHDESQNPYRWILVTSSGKSYIVDEIITNENQDLIIDYSSARHVTIERIMSVFPSEDYLLTPPSERKPFYNANVNW